MKRGGFSSPKQHTENNKEKAVCMRSVKIDAAGAWAVFLFARRRSLFLRYFFLTNRKVCYILIA